MLQIKARGMLHYDDGGGEIMWWKGGLMTAEGRSAGLDVVSFEIPGGRKLR